MIYSYKDIIDAVTTHQLTYDNIMQTKFNDSFVCCYDMKLCDLFALWDEKSINNNTIEEFESQLKQSRTTTERAIALSDKEDYRRDPDKETIEQNIDRRDTGYKNWVLSNFDKKIAVLSMISSENRTINIAFDKETNEAIFVRQSAWHNVYKTRLGQYNSFEYPTILKTIDTQKSVKEIISSSHGFSCVQQYRNYKSI